MDMGHWPILRAHHFEQGLSLNLAVKIVSNILKKAEGRKIEKE